MPGTSFAPRALMRAVVGKNPSVHTRVNAARMSAQCHIVFPDSKLGRACGAGPCPAGVIRVAFQFAISPGSSAVCAKGIQGPPAGHGPAPLGALSQRWETI